MCVGRNYVGHIKELGNEMPKQMVLFNKPNSAISDDLVARLDEPLHYEAEIALAVVEDRFRYVGFAFDLTKRKLQDELKEEGLPWERCKAFTGSALFSEFVELDSSIDELELELWVDGELRQSGGVATMINKPDAILAELMKFNDLEDYDIILTGTPKGVGALVSKCEYTGVIKERDRELVRKTWIAR